MAINYILGNKEKKNVSLTRKEQSRQLGSREGQWRWLLRGIRTSDSGLLCDTKVWIPWNLTDSYNKAYMIC